MNTLTRKPQWNRGKLVGQKRPLQLHEIWAIRIRPQRAGNLRELALFNLAIDSKLRGCDLVRLQVVDIDTLALAITAATDRKLPLLP